MDLVQYMYLFFLDVGQYSVLLVYSDGWWLEIQRGYSLEFSGVIFSISGTEYV